MKPEAPAAEILAAPPSLAAHPLPAYPVAGTFTLLVDRVVDGDTVDAFFLQPVRIRLDGLNAPPRGTPTGDAAALRVFELFHAVRSDLVLFEADLKGVYKYGGLKPELMAVVRAGGLDVGRVLLTDQLAKPWDGRGPRPESLPPGTILLEPPPPAPEAGP